MPNGSLRGLCHSLGRRKRLDAASWELHDIQQWMEAQYSHLLKRFPSIETRIVTNRNSLSGFSVMLNMQRVSQAWASILAAAIIIAASAATVFTLKEASPE